MADENAPPEIVVTTAEQPDRPALKCALCGTVWQDRNGLPLCGHTKDEWEAFYQTRASIEDETERRRRWLPV